MADCISGAIWDQVSRLGLRSSLPHLFNDLLNLDNRESRPLPERIRRSLGFQQANVSIQLLLQEPQETWAENSFMANQPNSWQIDTQVPTSSLQNCLVVVDAFCNSLLQPEDCADGWLLDSEEKLQVMCTCQRPQTYNKVTAASSHPSMTPAMSPSSTPSASSAADLSLLPDLTIESPCLALCPAIPIIAASPSGTRWRVLMPWQWLSKSKT